MNKARSVTPYSAVYEDGSNVAALKHFFRCLETSGTTMTDSKGGCVWDVSAGGKTLAFDQSGSSRTVAPIGIAIDGDPIPLSSGSFHEFTGTKPVLALLSARKIADAAVTPNYTRFAIGDINDILSYASPAGLGFSNGGFHVGMGHNGTNRWRMAAGESVAPGDVIRDAGTNLPISSIDEHFDHADVTDTTSATQGQDLMLLMVYEPGGEKSFTAYALDDRTKWLYGWTTTYDTIAAAFQPNPCMRVSNWACYGYALFEFDALPSDWLVASTWMAQEWKRGNRVIWPRWIGVS